MRRYLIRFNPRVNYRDFMDVCGRLCSNIEGLYPQGIEQTFVEGANGDGIISMDLSEEAHEIIVPRTVYTGGSLKDITEEKWKNCALSRVLFYVAVGGGEKMTSIEYDMDQHPGCVEVITELVPEILSYHLT